MLDLDYARSVRDGFVPPVDWVNDPPESTRHTPVTDVQTGGAL